MNEDALRCLSVRQPWAWLIVNGHKDVENREWPTRIRGRILIHASKRVTKAEYEACRLYMDVCVDAEIELPPMSALQRGGIVGETEIVDCVREHSSQWFTGDYGFVLANARPILFQPCKGALKFFRTPVLPEENHRLISYLEERGLHCDVRELAARTMRESETFLRCPIRQARAISEWVWPSPLSLSVPPELQEGIQAWKAEAQSLARTTIVGSPGTESSAPCEGQADCPFGRKRESLAERGNRLLWRLLNLTVNPVRGLSCFEHKPKCPLLESQQGHHPESAPGKTTSQDPCADSTAADTDSQEPNNPEDTHNDNADRTGDADDERV